MIETPALDKQDIASNNTDEIVTLTLPLENRQKSRLRATLDDGREVGIRLPREYAMPAGALLLASNNEIVRVAAANEAVSVASTSDSLLMKRACYHLGNRHVQLQVADSWLAYKPDHVLDQMLEGLGLQVEQKEQPFEPEDGAYSTSRSSSADGHGHSHGHSHAHSHHHHDH